MAKKNSPRLFAIIHIGSEQITFQISEFSDLNDLHVIERTSREVFLGEKPLKPAGSALPHRDSCVRCCADISV